MDKTTATLFSLGDCDPELAEKITRDIEGIVAVYIARNAHDIGARLFVEHAGTFERHALKALKNYLNQSPNIY